MESSLNLHCHAIHKASITIFFSPLTKPSSSSSFAQYPRPNSLLLRPRSQSQSLSRRKTGSADKGSGKSPLLQSSKSKGDSKGSSSLKLLAHDGDWSKEQFWAVVDSLRHDSRSHEIVQVFHAWKNIALSRANEQNYERIIDLLCEEGLMEEAALLLDDMENSNVKASLDIYNMIVHGFAGKGNFDRALLLLDQMKKADLLPDSYTYCGLIRAYGKFRMYDEMSLCVKKMELDGCLPDHVTYNLLIREFSQAGLLRNMESMERTINSKRMPLQASSLISMLHGYANFRVLDKMHKTYKRVLEWRIPLKKDLIRKMALVYIENQMFSRVDDLGFDHSLGNYSDMGWCLRILAQACLLSKKGMESVLSEMEEQNIPLNVTFVNIILLACLKMRDFKHLRTLLLQLPQNVRLDIVTVGVLVDANGVGFDGRETLDAWKRLGILDRDAELKTDSVVLAAFGKGQFLCSCENIYGSLEAVGRESKGKWTYKALIALVLKQHKKGLIDERRSNIDSGNQSNAEEEKRSHSLSRYQ